LTHSLIPGVSAAQHFFENQRIASRNVIRECGLQMFTLVLAIGTPLALTRASANLPSSRNEITPFWLIEADPNTD
jgi:hypothetical protein